MAFLSSALNVLISLVAGQGTAQATPQATSPPQNATQPETGGLIRVVPISEAPLGSLVVGGNGTQTTFGVGGRESVALAAGCSATGAQVQSALDRASASGGGTVYLAPGVYCVTQPLIVASKVYLIGAGIGSTILRGPAGSYAGKIINGAGVYSTVAAVAANGVSIQSLTIDHATNHTDANGVELIPDGVNYGGTLSSQCVVEDVQVLGAGNLHTYQIWNLRGQHIKILDNWVDGGVPTYAGGSDQEGIESYGGTDVLISGNTVQNIANSGLELGSAGIADSSLNGIFAVDNYVTNCNIGVSVFPTFDAQTGAQQTAGVHVKDNTIMNTWTSGIYAAAVAGTVNRDLQVTGNIVRNTGSGTTSGWAIFFNGDPTVAVTPSAVIANVISDNVIENAIGLNSYGILIIQFPNVRVVDNTITSVGHSGIYCYAAHDCDISRNRIFNVARCGILIGGPSWRPTVTDNVISQWATLASAAGISVNTAVNAVVRGNSFDFDNTSVVEAPAIRVEGGSDQVVVANNTLLFTPKMSYPFVNLSTNADSGVFAATTGQAGIAVTNSLLTAESRVMVTQTGGPPTTFAVSPFLGYFVVTLAAPSVSGAETFSYVVLP